ncbi:MAG: HNH endonuclease [Planctomycetota bacterium]
MNENQKPCPECGGPMHRQSKRCVKCHKKAIRKPGSYIARFCQYCGRWFEVHKSQVEAGWGKYCSHSCRAKHINPHPNDPTAFIDVPCQTCGTSFKKRRCEIGKTKGNYHFCSPECWYQFNTGDNHYLWAGGQDGRNSPEYKEWREAVLTRDYHLCMRCGSRDNLHAHHIEPWRDNEWRRYDPDNGIALCRECHFFIEQNPYGWAENLWLMIGVYHP